MARWRTIGGVALGAAGAAGLAYWVYEQTRDEPEHEALAREGAIELRRYQDWVVAETVAPGAFEAALDTGYKRLSAYLDGRDRGGAARLPMSVPVLTEHDAAGWRTRFVMPRGESEGTLPKPGKDVAIATLRGRRVAAIRFAGAWREPAFAARERDLRSWLSRRGERPAGPAEYAFYNAPFVPAPLRRNEVLIPLAD